MGVMPSNVRRYRQSYASAKGAFAHEELFDRIVWLTILRIALVSLLLAGTTYVLVRSDIQELGKVEQALYIIIGITYLISVAYLLILRTRTVHHRKLAYVQVIGDVIIVSCLVYLTGGVESIILLMYPVTVASAALLFYRRGALLIAFLCITLLVSICVGLNKEWLPSPSVRFSQSNVPLPRLLFTLFAHTSAICLTAGLASHLSEQLRSTRERLTLREHDYLALETIHESILRSIANGIVTTDRFGRITFVNAAGESICGFRYEDVRGSMIESYLPEVCQHLLKTEVAEKLEVSRKIPNSREVKLGFSAAPLFDREGNDQGHVIVVEDMTELRAMEEAMKRAERLAAIGSMAAGLAHELRNPLASMSGSIQLLGAGMALSGDELRLMSIVLKEANRLNTLISDFLQYARPSLAQLQPMELAEIARSTATLFRSDPSRDQFELSMDLENDLVVKGDAGQLNQVLWNLLANACEAMPGVGRIRIVVSKIANEAELQVCDNGNGINSEDLPYLFEPFYTTKSRGTGLGLAIVHSIVQGHGGWVLVQSEKGKGSIFSVRLPLLDRKKIEPST